MTTLRRHLAYALVLSVLAGELVLSCALAWVGSNAAQRTARSLSAQRSLVRSLQLSDLALWSEASYCRHPTSTDLFAPFAVHPGALEHSPAGSFVSPFASPLYGAMSGGGS